MNRVKKIDIENREYHFLDDMINIKSLDPNKINIDKRLYKNNLIYYIGYATIKSNLKINSVNTLYLIFIKINRYIEDSNGNKYLTLAGIDECKDLLEKYDELRKRSKILLGQ